MTATATPTQLEWHDTNVDLVTVERQLSGLWKQLKRTSAEVGVVRTSILNLVVYTDSQDDAEHVFDTLHHIKNRHPSRLIVLVGDRYAESNTIDGEVRVTCTSSGSGPQLCWEEIKITAHGRAADHLSSIVTPLLMPDLPTYLLWPGQPLFRHRLFRRLLDVSDRLILDSSRFHSPGDGYADLTHLCIGSQGVHDLHWDRLTPWREVVAQFFDGPTWLPYARGILSAEVEFGSGGNATAATAGLLLLTGWVATQLGWAPETTLDRVPTRDASLSLLQGERVIPITVQFRDHGASAAGLLMHLEIVSQPKGLQPARFRIDRLDDAQHAHVSMQVHDSAEVTRVVPLQPRSEYELLAEEMQLSSRDELYESTILMAAQIAGREVGLAG